MCLSSRVVDLTVIRIYYFVRIKSSKNLDLVSFFLVRIRHQSQPKFNCVSIISILSALAINSDIHPAKNYL
jgi:hypothetical protein